MILETVRMFRDALVHDTSGVNAQIRVLTLDPGDERPREIETVLDVTDYRGLVRGEDPLADPWLALVQDAPARVDGEVRNTISRDGEVTVSVIYGTNREGDEVVAESLYVCRSIVRALTALLHSSRVADRGRNGVCILSASSITYGPVDEDVLGATVRAAVTVTFDVRDIAPGGES